jgi:ABC-type multidrug transport system ATPase subunit
MVDGTVLLNGKETSQYEITKFSGYVHQHDAFIGTLTVREQLVFIVRMLTMKRNI